MPQGKYQEKGRRRNTQSRPRKLTPEAARDRFVEHMENGMMIGPALDEVGYARKTYEGWRRKHPEFAARVDQARQLRSPDRSVVRGERMGFAEWRKKYLNTETYWHQLQWIDLLEGREPRDMHPAQTYEKGKRNRLIVNVPPFHAKTATLSMDYVTYRLCMDPSFRVLLISAGSELAKDFLFGIKQRLTDPAYVDLQLAYAPDGGWEATSESWTESRIVFNQALRSQGGAAFHEKDANVLALGMRSKVYGRRADLVIVDDGVDTTNVSEHAKQMRWLRQMVESRLEAGGKLLVIGTRVASVDLYSELMKPENYGNGIVPWTYFASPAILEEGKTPQQHVTLWPYAQVPWVRPEDAEMDECLCGEKKCSDGLVVGGKKMYARWDGVHLERGPRDANSATDWALIYQQKAVSENATFPEHAIQEATNAHRLCGRLEHGKLGHPLGGMHDKYVIGGLDPSIKGFAGMVVIAVDKESHKRYVLTAVNMRAPTGEELKNRMKELSEVYGIHEWRVEKTGLLQFFTQDLALRTWFQQRGIRFVEHTTGANKWDAGFGISSMAPLFGEYDKAWDAAKAHDYGWRTITEPLIELPRHNQEGMKALVHQLLIWTPDLDPKKVPCDLVMALWFANTGAREYLGVGRNGNVISFGRRNKFQSPKAQKNRVKVSLADFQSGF
ncbi:MAG TPA: hypothetical protein VFH56_13245 [Acidimicrobiales bacterium]|nr:hypothetical protein [Acidimicrobiales bacterium]